MSPNMGSFDRIFRFLVALGVVILYVSGTIGGLTLLVLGILALVFLGTSFVGTCPLYIPFGFSTRGSTKK